MPRECTATPLLFPTTIEHPKRGTIREAGSDAVLLTVFDNGRAVDQYTADPQSIEESRAAARDALAATVALEGHAADAVPELPRIEPDLDDDLDDEPV